ncbi:putative acyl-coenzyme A synthetase [Colletotrichum tanaceti]|uniref:Putative acyl-coenzyme A synthetase n=1 Tax=Colletotrichum tanaceti TaxID=1306861 RepID=A0A4U6XL69_9PEZI|nr:putative acyl-coenzyme A synthetase [Colletotrichum tanaceti]TKW56363.1 putative acyl-coenzyme A synthetase [Colletotrichum tanaceti]
MSTIVEKRGGQTIYRSPDTIDLPSVDLLTFLFDSPNERLHDDTVLHADAADPSRCITKSRLVKTFKRLAHALRHQYGIRKGDAVQVLFSGHYMAPAVFYGIMAAGGAVAASTPSSSPPEVARQVKLTESKMVICSPDLKALAAAGGTAAGLPDDRILYIGDSHEFQLFEARSGKPVAVPDEQLDWERVTDRPRLENTVGCFIYSSGTTGIPKAVKVSHANMIAETVCLSKPIMQYFEHERAPRYVTLAHLPAAHISGLQAYIINQTYMGGVVYWMKKFDFAEFLGHMKRYRVNFFFSVPPIYLLIAKSPLVKDHFDHVALAISGAAALGRETQTEAQRKMGRGKAVLVQTWGLSETSAGFTLLPPDVRDDTGSISSLLANCEGRLVDDEGADVEVGQPGEMWVRGPLITKGYYHNDKANEEAFVDGWFCTGDRLYFKDGKFYFVDRKKELIKYNGFQVAPAELEALLVTHPKIQDAAVIGVDGEGTELPRAYVVADKKDISAEDIKKWVAEQVASCKKLRGGVVFIDAIPKSASGKILRKDLGALVKREAGAKLFEQLGSRHITIMGLRTSLKNLVSKNDTSQQPQQPTTCCNHDVQLLLPYSNFTPSNPETRHHTRDGFHFQRTETSDVPAGYHSLEKALTRKPVSPPASTLDATTNPLDIMGEPHSAHDGTACSEKQYSLAEMAARVAYTAQGNIDSHRANDRDASTPSPDPVIKVGTAIAIKRGPLTDHSKDPQSSNMVHSPPSLATADNKSLPSPPSYSTCQGGGRVDAVGSSTYSPAMASPASGHDSFHSQVTSWASTISTTTSRQPSGRQPSGRQLGTVSEETSGDAFTFLVPTPAKPKRKSKKTTVARSHLSRGTMRASL